MKKAFSLFEIIIVLIVISIITTYALIKTNSTIKTSIKSKVKGDIALIRNAITTKNSKQILLDDEELNSLDNASINTQNEELFSKILDISLLSTSRVKKELGSWIKISSNRYLVYLDETTFLEFNYENSTFVCKSAVNLCKEYE